MEAYNLAPTAWPLRLTKSTSASARSGLIEFIESVCYEEGKEDYLDITARYRQSRRTLARSLHE